MSDPPKAPKLKSPAKPKRPGSRRFFLLILLLVIAWPIRRQLGNVARAVRLAFDPVPVVLPIPVEGVKAEDLEDTWGGIRSGGRHHEGIDIFAPRGNHITSATPGFVTGRGWNRLGGRFIQVLGAGGRSYYYAHLDAFDEAEVGDWVEVGDLLGYVGTSGNANGTPPHLHFGVYLIGSRAIDPYPLLVPNPPAPRAESDLHPGTVLNRLRLVPAVRGLVVDVNSETAGVPDVAMGREDPHLGADLTYVGTSTGLSSA